MASLDFAAQPEGLPQLEKFIRFAGRFFPPIRISANLAKRRSALRKLVGPEADLAHQRQTLVDVLFTEGPFLGSYCGPWLALLPFPIHLQLLASERSLVHQRQGR